MSKEKRDPELPGAWRQIHGAIWLIGLAIIAWQGWWWPGLLVLVAISGLAEAGIRLYLNRQAEQKTMAESRVRHLPANCPNCGGPIDAAKVRWSGSYTAICPFCGATVKALETNESRQSEGSN